MKARILRRALQIAYVVHSPYLPSRLNSRYKRVKFVHRTHNYLSPRAARFRNRRNDFAARQERRLCVSRRAEERDPTRFSPTALSSRKFRDEAPIARDLFTSTWRGARKLSLSDETRAQIAIKTFRFYSRTSPLPRERRVPREKADGISEWIEKSVTRKWRRTKSPFL